VGGIPFKDYDFWAYLSAGFLFLFALDHVLGTKLMMREQWTVVQGVIAASAAYTVGHLVAGLSSQLFERLLVRRLLGAPSEVLLDSATPAKAFKLLLPLYYSALPSTVIDKVATKATAAGITGTGESLFWPAYDAAKNTPAVMARLQTFINQYGFCRNMALVALVDACLLGYFYKWGAGVEADRWYAWGAAVIGCGLLFRYLKFYRLYSVEIYTSYAFAKITP
jgi:hypothetical protein